MVVVEIAKSGRSTCRTCNKFIEQDTIRIGTTVSNEGYINVEWHHSECFWTKRGRQYFYRKGKKINTVLKYDQFSGVDKISGEQREEIRAKILEANLRWATDQALQKVGIVRDAAVIEAKEAGDAETQPKTSGKGGRKRKAAAEPEVEEESEQKPESTNETEEAAPAKRGGRKAKALQEVAAPIQEAKAEPEESARSIRAKRRKN